MIIHADYAFVDGKMQQSVQIEIEENLIVRVGKQLGSPDLMFKIILPGFVSTHSHGFQHAMPYNKTNNFWEWRKGMYQFVNSLNEDNVYQIYLDVFNNMLRNGITCVGEFHYLHHSNDNKISSRQENYRLDEVVCQAARDTGIRLKLLQCFYERSGFNVSLEPDQIRFGTSIQSFEQQLDHLIKEGVDVGIACHSVRTVTEEMIIRLHKIATDKSLPFHIHLEEQEKEIKDCLNIKKTTPLKLLNRLIVPNHSDTAIHLNHQTDHYDYHICACPTTEAYLGDGLPNQLATCFGTDRNIGLSMLQEMQLYIYSLQMIEKRQNVKKLEDVLFMATAGGARSLGVRTGELKPNHFADFIVIDYDGTEPLEELIFGKKVSICNTWVNGRKVEIPIT